MKKTRKAKNDNIIKVYVLIAITPAGNEQHLIEFAKKMGEDALGVLRSQVDVEWEYHLGDIVHLKNTETKRPDDFLRESFLRMVQNSCDVVLVVTDASLMSESKFIVPGLTAPEAQVMVISTQKLLTVPVGEKIRKLEDSSVRFNAATLFWHLVGHILNLKHSEKGIMAPYHFNEERKNVERFNTAEQEQLKDAAKKLVVREIPAKGKLKTLEVHLNSLANNPKDVMKIAWRSKAVFLPLTLTKLTTAAIAPAMLMFFTDEFWWVGIHRSPTFIYTAAAVAILTATFYIPFSQDLLFPHRERRVITSNVATSNMGMLISIFFMVVGLFIFVSLSILLLEFWLFPPELIASWFNDSSLEVGWYQHFKIAVVVGTLGTLTGALGSGFHGREIIRAVSFFYKEP